MARKDRDNSIIWKDRKRFMGMPLSFTKYMISDNRLIVKRGFFTTETDEILLYRVLDIKLKRTFGQKLYGVGTITLYSADQSTPTLELKNIKRPDAVRRLISKVVEEERLDKGLAGQEIYGTINTAGVRPHAHQGAVASAGSPPQKPVPQPAQDSKKQRGRKDRKG